MEAMLPTPAPRSGLHGREEVRERLRRHLASAEHGAGGLVWISGEAGIGKTRLLLEVDRLGSSAGAQVLHGSGWADLGTPPFWLWTQVLREGVAGREPAELEQAWGSRSRAALGLLPELGEFAEPGAEGAGRFPLFDAFDAVLDRLAEERALVLLLDDLHWTDAGSLTLLGFLARRCARRRVLLVGAWRTHEVGHGSDLAPLAEELATTGDHVSLAGLDEEAVRRLVAETAGLDLDLRQAGDLRARTEGNPLFVGELARLVRDRGAGVVLHAVPDTAQSIIRRRLGRVSQATHAILGVAAVTGSSTPFPVVARLAGVGLPAVAAATDEGAAAALVERSPAGVRFAHPLIRDVLVESVPPDRVREIHLARAESLREAAAGDPTLAAEITHHLLRALPLGSVDDAVHMGSLAGQVAYRAQAYEEAARHFREVLAVLPDGQEHRADLLVRHGQALVATGDLAAARAAFLAAADAARDQGRWLDLAQAALGFGSGLSGFEVQLWDQAQIDLLDEALDHAPPDSPVRVDLLARLSVALSFTDRVRERVALAEEAVTLARQVGEDRYLGHALAAHCDAIAGPGHSERREQEAGEVITRAARARDRGLQLLGLRLRVVARLEQGRFREAREDMEAFGRLASQVRQPLYSWYVPLWQGFRAHLTGDLTRLDASRVEVERVGRMAGSRNAAALAFVQGMWLAIETRQLAGAIQGMSEVVEELGEIAPDGGTLLHLFEGQPDHLRLPALARIEDVVAALPVDAEYVANLCHVAEGLWYAPAGSDAAAVVRRALEPHLHRFSVDGIGAGSHGSVARLVAALATLEGRFDEGAALFEVALEANERVGATLPLAHTRRMYAELLRRRDRPEDPARRAELIDQAADDYRRMGLAARLEELLAGAAPHATPDPPDPDPTLGRLRRDGELWRLDYAARSAVVRHAKGMVDLATLLSAPGHEVHVLDLVSSFARGQGSVADAAHGPEGDLGPVIDDRARVAYQRRLTELDQELADADAAGDQDGAERAGAERDALVAQLTTAYGLGGRARRAGDPAERARSTVTRRIRDAIRRIEQVHPALGRHLDRAVRTGLFCVYLPDRPHRWEL